MSSPIFGPVPTTEASAASLGSLSRAPGGKMGKDEFLKLLLTQLKNQDPSKPMDGQDLAVQLATFSQVEQLVSLNDGITKLGESNNQVIYGLNTSLATNLIGRSVLAEGNSVSVDGSGLSDVTVEVGNPGGNGVLRVYDKSGKEVAAQSYPRLTTGRHSLEWVTGKLPEGEYTYKLEVAGASETPVPVVTYSSYPVDSVQFGPQGVMLVSRGRQIPMEKVAEVSK